MDTHSLNSGKYDTFIYHMPEGLTGVYFWKLEVVDADGLKCEATDVFFLKGDEMVINVLQVYPPNNTGDLKTLLQTKINGQALGFHAGEYKINITQVSVSSFNSMRFSDLNGVYNMIIFGFQDEYGNQDLNSNGISILNQYIATGQSVMFTHDTIEWSGYRNSQLLTNFRDDVGQTDKITATQVVRTGTIARLFPSMV